jgi:catechol 2,3-dioxygenase-like lactoylglutathione lyase family enzyme
MSDYLLQHVNVNVDDLDRAVAFYRSVLGLPLDPTPDQGFRSQFFRCGPNQQIHMNEIEDSHQFRGHFCIWVPDFAAVFQRAKAAGAIDTQPWGRVRRLPSGSMQMFVRDPAGNLIEIGSASDAVIDPKIFADELVEPRPGVYRMAPGQTRGEGRHESP